MMTSSNGNIFRVTGPLEGKSTGHRCILLTKGTGAKLWCFPWSAPEQTVQANTGDAGDLRRHRTHYDVTVMTNKFRVESKVGNMKSLFYIKWNVWYRLNSDSQHYNDVIMTTIASQITSLAVVYSTVYSDEDQRKHQSSASLAFVWGIHRYRWIPRTKGQLRGKCFHLMTSLWISSKIALKFVP